MESIKNKLVKAAYFAFSIAAQVSVSEACNDAVLTARVESANVAQIARIQSFKEEITVREPLFFNKRVYSKEEYSNLNSNSDFAFYTKWVTPAPDIKWRELLESSDGSVFSGGTACCMAEPRSILVRSPAPWLRKALVFLYYFLENGGLAAIPDSGKQLVHAPDMGLLLSERFLNIFRGLQPKRRQSAFGVMCEPIQLVKFNLLDSIKLHTLDFFEIEAPVYQLERVKLKDVSFTCPPLMNLGRPTVKLHLFQNAYLGQSCCAKEFSRRGGEGKSPLALTYEKNSD